VVFTISSRNARIFGNVTVIDAGQLLSQFILTEDLAHQYEKSLAVPDSDINAAGGNDGYDDKCMIRGLYAKVPGMFQRARAQPGQLGQMHLRKKPEWLLYGQIFAHTDISRRARISASNTLRPRIHP
jgi:hypothetical protein